MLKNIKNGNFKKMSIEINGTKKIIKKDDINYLFIDLFDNEVLIEGDDINGRYFYFKSTDYNFNDIQFEIIGDDDNE